MELLPVATMYQPLRKRKAKTDRKESLCFVFLLDKAKEEELKLGVYLRETVSL